MAGGAAIEAEIIRKGPHADARELLAIPKCWAGNCWCCCSRPLAPPGPAWTVPRLWLA
jgi:hypothetical protein